jgi:asparagine synthase (glutamine-hydrolysing)
VDWRSCLNLETGEGKIPLRRSLARHTPHITPGKRGFTVPMDEWLKGPLRPMFEDLLLQRKELLGLEMQPNAMRTMFERHISGSQDHAWGLWIFLSLALWEKKHFQHKKS